MNHRTIEWFGLEGTLKLIQFQPPAMSRDIFHQPRVLRAGTGNCLLCHGRSGAGDFGGGEGRREGVELRSRAPLLLGAPGEGGAVRGPCCCGRLTREQKWGAGGGLAAWRVGHLCPVWRRRFECGRSEGAAVCAFPAERASRVHDVRHRGAPAAAAGWRGAFPRLQRPRLQRSSRRPGAGGAAAADAAAAARRVRPAAGCCLRPAPGRHSAVSVRSSRGWYHCTALRAALCSGLELDVEYMYSST